MDQETKIETESESGTCVYLQLNSICNQRCLFCNRPPINGDEPPTPLDLVTNKIDCLANDSNVKRIVFTGGEPTLYPYLKEVISYAAHKNKTVEIQTNATILDKNGFKELKDAGLSIVNMAFHSHIDVTSRTLRGVPFGDQRIKENLVAISNLGIELHVIFVINKINFRELPDFVDYLSQMDIDWRSFYLNLSIVVPEGWARENKEMIVPRMSDIKPYLVEACARCVQYDIKFDISEFVPLCIVPGFEHKAISTVFRMTKVKIIDDHYGDEKVLDFVDPDGPYASKAPQCAQCSLNSICVGFYPALKDMHGVEDYEPSNKDPQIIINKIMGHVD